MKKITIGICIFFGILFTFLFQNCNKNISESATNSSGSNINYDNYNFNADTMNTKIMSLMAKANVPLDNTEAIGASSRSVSHMICGSVTTASPLYDCSFYKRLTPYEIKTYSTSDSDARLVYEYIKYKGAPLATDASVVGYSGYRIINLSCSQPVVPNPTATCAFSF